MPHLIVRLAAGRDAGLKQALADRLAATVAEALNLGNDAVSIEVDDIPTEDWMARVYRPEIMSAGARLLKRPGYGPLAQDDEQ